MLGHCIRFFFCCGYRGSPSSSTGQSFTRARENNQVFYRDSNSRVDQMLLQRQISLPASKRALPDMGRREATAFIPTLPLARSTPNRASQRNRFTCSPVMAAAKTAVVQIGTGTDLHGQNPTTAAVRACRNAIEYNSLPALKRLVSSGDLADIQVDVQLGVPQPFLNGVDVEKVKKQFPYGQVSVRVEHGGLCCSSGVVLPDQGDPEGDDRAIVVVAAVSVLC